MSLEIRNNRVLTAETEPIIPVATVLILEHGRKVAGPKLVPDLMMEGHYDSVPIQVRNDTITGIELIAHNGGVVGSTELTFVLDTHWRELKISTWSNAGWQIEATLGGLIPISLRDQKWVTPGRNEIKFAKTYLKIANADGHIEGPKVGLITENGIITEKWEIAEETMITEICLAGENGFVYGICKSRMVVGPKKPLQLNFTCDIKGVWGVGLI